MLKRILMTVAVVSAFILNAEEEEKPLRPKSEVTHGVIVSGGLRRPWYQWIQISIDNELNHLKKAAQLPVEKKTYPKLKPYYAEGFWGKALVLPYYHRELSGRKNNSKAYGFRFSTCGPFQNDTVYGVSSSVFTEDAGSVFGWQCTGFTEKAETVGGIQTGLVVTSVNKLYGFQYATSLAEARNMYGIQLSVYMTFDHISNGLQLSGLGNVNVIRANGIQIAGISNKTEELNGVQISLLGNYVSDIANGLQISLFNHTDSGHVFQIGLINHIDEALFPYFPFFNFKF